MILRFLYAIWYVFGSQWNRTWYVISNQKNGSLTPAFPMKNRVKLPFSCAHFSDLWGSSQLFVLMKRLRCPPHLIVSFRIVSWKECLLPLFACFRTRVFSRSQKCVVCFFRHTRYFPGGHGEWKWACSVCCWSKISRRLDTRMICPFNVLFLDLILTF